MTSTDRTRFWDRNWNCVYDSLSATQTPEEFIREHDWLNTTVDTADGQRWIGRWINNNGDIEKCCEGEYLTQIKAWTNPFMEPEHQFPRQHGPTWVDVINRILDLEWQAAGMAPIPDDPFDPAPWVKLADGCGPVEHATTIRRGNGRHKVWLGGKTPRHEGHSIDRIELDEPPRADGRPHPPRPTTTLPMWAQVPNRSRRR